MAQNVSPLPTPYGSGSVAPLRPLHVFAPRNPDGSSTEDEWEHVVPQMQSSPKRRHVVRVTDPQAGLNANLGEDQ